MKPVPMIAVRIVFLFAIVLDPPGSARLLTDHNTVQKVRSLGQAFLWRQQAVFVLDGQYMIVAEHPQRGNKLAPPFSAMAITTGAENPATIALLGVWPGIEHTGARQVRGIKLRIFGVNVEDGAFEYANGSNGINALPEKMAGIEVAAYAGSRDGAQLEHRFWAIHDKSGMHFDGDFHTMVGRKLRVLHPVRRDHFAPLPVQHLQVVGRPRTRHPVGGRRVRRIAGTSGEINHNGDAELFREQDSLSAHV